LHYSLIFNYEDKRFGTALHNAQLLPVMWSETVGLRTRPVWDQNKSVLVLVLQVWCCIVKHCPVTLVVIMILKDTATFQVLFNSFSILSLELHYYGDQ